MRGESAGSVIPEKDEAPSTRRVCDARPFHAARILLARRVLLLRHGQRLDVDEEAESAGRLHAEVESDAGGRAVGERRGRGDEALAETGVESAAVLPPVRAVVATSMPARSRLMYRSARRRVASELSTRSSATPFVPPPLSSVVMMATQ